MQKRKKSAKKGKEKGRKEKSDIEKLGSGRD